MVGGLGGVSLGVGILINVLSLAVSKLVELATAKKELIEVDQDFVVANNLLADSANGFNLSQAGLAATLLNTAEAQKKLDSATSKLSANYQFLAVESRQVTHVTSDLKRVIDSEKEALLENTKEAQLQQKAVAENVAILRTLRDVFGFTTPELLKMAGAVQATTAEKERLAKAINSDIDALRKFSADLTEATGRMFNAEKAALNLGIALKTIRPPDFNITALQGASEAIAVIARGIATLQAQGITDPLKQAAGLDKEIAAAVQLLQLEAAALGKTDAQRRAIFEQSISDVREYFPEIARLIEIEAARAKGMDAFNEKQKKTKDILGETTEALRREAQMAEFVGDTFDAQEARIRTAIQHRILDLEKAGTATRTNILRLKEIELRQLTEVTDKRIEALAKEAKLRESAEQEVARRLASINAKTITDDYERHKAAIETNLEADLKAARAAGIAENNLVLVRVDFRKAREQEFLNWVFEETVKTAKAIEKTITQIQLESDRERYRRQAELLQNQSDQFLQQQSRIDGLDQQFRLPGGAALDINQLDEAAKLMEQLGVTVQDVDNIFGSSSSSVGQFTERLNILAGAQVSTIDTLKQLIDWQQIFVQVIGIAQQAISDLVSGSDKGGKAILASFLQMIAGIATTLGTLFLLAGAGFIVLPGFQWSGGALIAAGSALIVFAGVLGGLATLLTKEDSAAGATTGGGASSAASSGGGGNQGRPPNVIPFPTSGGPQGGDSYNVIKLDRQGTRDFLEGNEVVTMEDVRGTGPHGRGFWRGAERELNRKLKAKRAS